MRASRLALPLVAVLALGGCAQMSPNERSTLTGAGIGAAVGGIAGSFAGHAGWGAAIGGAVGAGAGYLYQQTVNSEQRAQAQAYQRGYDQGLRTY